MNKSKFHNFILYVWINDLEPCFFLIINFYDIFYPKLTWKFKMKQIKMKKWNHTFFQTLKGRSRIRNPSILIFTRISFYFMQLQESYFSQLKASLLTLNLKINSWSYILIVLVGLYADSIATSQSTFSKVLYHVAGTVYILSHYLQDGYWCKKILASSY